MESYINDHGKTIWRGATSESAFIPSDFSYLPPINEEWDSTYQWTLHTNIGSLTVVDRMTGYDGGIRDVETGFRDIDGKFWLASCMNDVRKSGAKTLGEAIAWVKKRANTCNPDRTADAVIDQMSEAEK